MSQQEALIRFIEKIGVRQEGGEKILSHFVVLPHLGVTAGDVDHAADLRPPSRNCRGLRYGRSAPPRGGSF